MKKMLKVGLLSLGVMAIMGGAVLSAQPAKAYTNNLSDLITVNGLFGNASTYDLAGLIAVDNATGPGMGGAGSQNLSDLIITNGLFGTGNAYDLAALIAVDNATY